MRALITTLAVWAAGLGAAAQFGKISILFKTFGAEYPGSSAVELGLIVSIVGVVGLIFGTTAGLLVARIGPRRGIVAALVMGAAMSLVQSQGLPYGALIASRVVEGVSHLAIVVIGPTLMAGLVADRFRGFAMTLWSSFFGVTYALLALFAAEASVSGLFLGHALWMAGVAVLLAALLPRDVRLRVPMGQGGLMAQHAAIYRSPSISAPAMGFFCYTFLFVALLTLLPPEVPPAQRAWVAVGMPLISITVSLSLGVWLLGRMAAWRVVQLGYLLAVPGFVALLLGWGQGAVMAAVALWIASVLGLVQGASFAAIPQLNPTVDGRARSAGAIAQLGNVGTTTGTPVLAAVLAAAGPWGLTIVAVGACVLGVTLHQLQARRRESSQ
jgi:DHA1 family inner membrane transport protein